MKKLIIIILLFALAGCTTNTQLGAGEEKKEKIDKEKIERVEKIKDKIKIGNDSKEISFTDEDSEEDFIIKTDEKDYIGFGGSSAVYFSVTNISDKKQGAKVLFSFLNTGHLDYVERFEYNEEVETPKLIPETSTTTEKTILATSSHPVFKNIPLRTAKIDKEKYNTKDVKERKQDGWFYDMFEIDETKYYMAAVKIPMTVEPGEEWFIEAFSDDYKYGHLDPNLWTYEQKFNDLTTGDLDGQDNWTETNTNGSQDVVTTGTPYEGTKHVKFHLDTSGGNHFHRAITSLVSGTFYFSFKTSSATEGYFILYVRGVGFGPYAIGYNGHSVSGGDYKFIENNNPFGTLAADTYYRMGVAFECGSGEWEGLSADTFKVNVDDGDWQTASSFRASQTSINDISFLAYEPGGMTFYLDYISSEYGGSTPTTERRIMFTN